MSRTFLQLGVSLAITFGFSGCGVGFDPGSEVVAMRVLGVRKDQPFPAPGETVNLSLLWHNGAPGVSQQAEVIWLPPCFNPPGDQYSACIPQFVQQLVTKGTGFDQLPRGETTSLQVPLDVIPTESTPGVPRYGLTYAFFMVCAGTVAVEVPLVEGALPVVCRNADGERLGPESFVIGYSALFSYPEFDQDGEAIKNQNPIVEGFEVQGTQLESCENEACLTQSAEVPIDCAATPERCFPACQKDGDQDCPKIWLRPLVPESSAEPDEISDRFYGRSVTEQMWINYYTNRGSVRGDGVRLLNDASKGWSEDYGIAFYAPKEPGPVTLWAVAHDNRGGSGWTRTRIWIE